QLRTRKRPDAMAALIHEPATSLVGARWAWREGDRKHALAGDADNAVRRMARGSLGECRPAVRAGRPFHRSNAVWAAEWDKGAWGDKPTGGQPERPVHPCG